MNNFWTEADSSAPFNMYKDKVHYDYILTAKMPIKFILCCIVTYLITKRRRNINIKL